jgi:hypothetical protein
MWDNCPESKMSKLTNGDHLSATAFREDGVSDYEGQYGFRYVPTTDDDTDDPDSRISEQRTFKLRLLTAVFK